MLPSSSKLLSSSFGPELRDSNKATSKSPIVQEATEPSKNVAIIDTQGNRQAIISKATNILRPHWNLPTLQLDIIGHWSSPSTWPTSVTSHQPSLQAEKLALDRAIELELSKRASKRMCHCHQTNHEWTGTSATYPSNHRYRWAAARELELRAFDQAISHAFHQTID